jgi:hypothetical protein
MIIFVRSSTEQIARNPNQDLGICVRPFLPILIWIFGDTKNVVAANPSNDYWNLIARPKQSRRAITA